jgi:hypothetical protein
MKSPPYPTNEKIEARFVWGLLEIKQEKYNENDRERNKCSDCQN